MKIEKQKLLKYSFITFAIVIIIFLIDTAQFIELTSRMSLPLFSVVVFIVTFDQAYMGAKWHYLLRVFHINAPFAVPVLAYLRGRIFQFVAPSSLGIDAYKTYCVRKYHNETTPIVSSIIVERAFGAMSSLAILLLLLPFCADILELPYKEYVGWISILGFLGLCIIIHMMQTKADIILKLKFPGFFPKKSHDLLNNLVINLAKIKEGKRRIWIYFLLSIIEKMSYGLAVYYCSRAIGLTEPGLLLIISVAPIFALLERLPISISAIGIREGLFVILFTPYYKDPTIPITVSLILRAAEITQIIFFLGTWFIGRDKKTIEKEIQSVEDEYNTVS